MTSPAILTVFAVEEAQAWAFLTRFEDSRDDDPLSRRSIYDLGSDCVGTLMRRPFTSTSTSTASETGPFVTSTTKGYRAPAATTTAGTTSQLNFSPRRLVSVIALTATDCSPKLRRLN